MPDLTVIVLAAGGGTRMKSTARFGVTPGPGASGSAVTIDGGTSA